MNIKNQIQNILHKHNVETILIHSDIMRGFEVPFKNKENFLLSHMEQILSLKQNLNIWMPAFNYDFCKGVTYNVNETTSQVGVLTEYFRKKIAHWRTTIPVFSFAGTGLQPVINISDIIDPFDNNSAFNILYENNSYLMHYGSLINHSTILHYAERISNCLTYRYDKLFKGTVKTQEGQLITVKFNFHVRPLGKHLDYNWEIIEKDLIEENIITVFSEGQCKILICNIKDLINYWTNRLRLDPLYLLDKESKMWIKPMLDKIGRPFILSDFEIM